MTQFDDTLVIKSSDLDAAVAASVIDRATADRLTGFVLHNVTGVVNSADEEQFRLITGFNDIFVTIGIALFLSAVGYLSADFGIAVSSFVVAAASWSLAEVFTRRKRMALPSIVLLACFGVAIFLATHGLQIDDTRWRNLFAGPDISLQLAISGLAALVMIAVHWIRFHVPITIAAAFEALAITVAGAAESIVPGILENWPIIVFVPLGLAAFCLAMYFDLSDLQRRTRRTDIAFWLHLLAAPLIVHPLVREIANVDRMTVRDAGVIFGMFAIISLVALTVDRRALLVSSLIYLGYATFALFSNANWGSYTYGVALLSVGTIVLVLSIAWQPLRAIVVKAMPIAIRSRVPATAQ